ncbi:hypothetical protein Y032_0016g3018 [Ancylostoma ceylanicum]|uniref:7TM GPCR serpentine receptor class x (Srx) domain-containing protein n=1 Tax=Ancylostoma ceylanicum TaxID=53326 RepID=A0A016V863_9BILA|nr:hypothetical protein Y032_0016g3018 [Ancylostoma ceylanicum]
MSYYTSVFLPIHNITIVVTLISLYAVLCTYVVMNTRSSSSKIKKMQLSLFLQSLFICASTTAASLLYVYMNFFESPRYVVIGANVVWQMSHGVHGFVYISMNREIRKEILVLFYRGSYTSSSVEKLNTTQQAANAHTSKTYANRTNAFATNSCSDQQSGR